MQFAAAGRVVTQDGQEIAFRAELYMSRSFVANSSLTLIGGNAVMTDPLVINFDGTGAQLENTRFAFDLDSDGTSEQIANLRPNSGYLALDRNGDGVINNGGELFGPVSNNGFTELAAYDDDGNGFIDEGDAVNLSVTPADAGSEDTFTYAWSVTKGGVAYALAATMLIRFCLASIGKLLQGVSHGYLALYFDSAAVIDEKVPLETLAEKPELRPYPQVITAALFTTAVFVAGGAVPLLASLAAGPTGRVVAFEPHREFAFRVQENGTVRKLDVQAGDRVLRRSRLPAHRPAVRRW